MAKVFLCRDALMVWYNLPTSYDIFIKQEYSVLNNVTQTFLSFFLLRCHSSLIMSSDELIMSSDELNQMRKVVQVMTVIDLNTVHPSDEESSSSDDSDRFEYSSSSDNDESSDSDSSEEITIPEDYQPEEGVEGDDDRNECCHWSTQQTEHSRIRKRRGITKSGGPRQRYPDQTSSSDLAFIDRAIRCTNIHGQRDAKFLD